MKPSYLLALDQGTTGSRAILYHSSGRKVGAAYEEFRQYYPKPGWVEHDANEIWSSVRSVIQKSIQQARVSKSDLMGIAITNQRETSVFWDSRTGKTLGHAIVWQDRRTSEDCLILSKKYSPKRIRQKTGLVFDPYFSASKIAWKLKHSKEAKDLARRGFLRFGTIDSWLLWNLSGGKIHATDFTNASRTLLFDIQKRKWSAELLDLFKIPRSILPEVRDSGNGFGQTGELGFLPSGITIQSILGDQQAALYGQSCYEKGAAKNTYGTGCFLVMQAGRKFHHVPEGLLMTLAVDRQGAPTYAFEGSIFIAGAAIQWLRDGLQFFKKSSETQRLIQGLDSSGGVTVIPAFVGLGSPYWRSDVRGSITGITRGTTRAHLIRATLESVAHQTADVLEVMTNRGQWKIHELQVDGGMTANPFLMQFQADLLGIPVLASHDTDLTCWGTAKLAGRKLGFWKSEPGLELRKSHYTRFLPKMKRDARRQLRDHWRKELERLLAGH